MPVQITEVQPNQTVKHNWTEMAIALQPITETLSKEDRDYFEGPLSFLIGKEPRMANIDKKYMWLFIQEGNLIVDMYKAYKIYSINDSRSRLIKYLHKLALSLAEEGLLIKYGIGGYSRQYIEQKVTSENIDHNKKKSFWG